MNIGKCYRKKERKCLTTSGVPAGKYILKMLVGNKPSVKKSVAKHADRTCRFECHSGLGCRHSIGDAVGGEEQNLLLY